MNIGDKIKNAREENKLTQTQASESLMVSRQTISNWENGKSLPDILSVIRMSELYQISLDEFQKYYQSYTTCNPVTSCHITSACVQSVFAYTPNPHIN